jgi:putative transposase
MIPEPSYGYRCEQVNAPPNQIASLTDDGSCFIVNDAKPLLRENGMEARTTPVSSPETNVMAEAFVKSCKRDMSMYIQRLVHRA